MQMYDEVRLYHLPRNWFGEAIKIISAKKKNSRKMRTNSDKVKVTLLLTTVRATVLDNTMYMLYSSSMRFEEIRLVGCIGKSRN